MESKSCAAKVGGIAFALGLGVGVATTPGIALADTESSSPERGSISSQADAPKTDSPAGRSQTETPREDVATAKRTTDRSPAKDRGEETRERDRSGVANAPGDGGNDSSTPAVGIGAAPSDPDERGKGAHEAADVGVVPPQPSRSNTPWRSSNGQIDRPSRPSTRTPARAAMTADSTNASLEATASPKAPDTITAPPSSRSVTSYVATARGPAAVSAGPVAASTAGLIMAVTPARAAVPAVRQQIAAAVSDFLRAFGFGASATQTPASPTESPAMWAVLAWTRRQTQQAVQVWGVQTPAASSPLFTSGTAALVTVTPTNSPPQVTSAATAGPPNATTGVVTGSIGVTDPDGDTLAYSLSAQPAHGAVTLNPNGTYTYTPTQAGRFIAGTTSGVDSDPFTVSVTDGRSTPISVRVTPILAAVVAQVQTVPVGTTPVAVVAGPDGRAYVLNTGTKTINVIYPNGATFSVPAGNVPFEGDLALSPDGRRLYVSQGTDNSVLVYDTNTGAILANFPVSNGATGIATSGGRVYVANFNSRTVSAVDATTYKVFAEVPVGKDAFKIAVSPDGQRIYVTSFQGTTQVLATIDATTGAVTQMPFSAQSSAFSPDGSRLYLTTPNSLSILDPRPSSPTYNQVVGSIAIPNAAFVAVSPDGSLAYVTQPNGTNGVNDTIAVVDTATKTIIGTIAVGDFPFEITVSPDGSRIYSANANSSSVSLITLIPA